MIYFRLDDRVDDPDGQLAKIGDAPALAIPWRAGVPYDGGDIPDPICCALDRRSGAVVPDLFLGGIPIFSYRLLAALDAAGVDNLVRYNLDLSDPRGGVHHDYKAVNLLATVACADPGRSRIVDGKVQRLAIDEARAGGKSIFWLAEDPTFLIIDERVKLAIDEAALLGVVVRGLDDPRAY